MADDPDPLIDDVLDLLDGWAVNDEEGDPDPTVDDGEVHTVTTAEVTKFITKSRIRAAGHIGLENVEKLPSTVLVDEAVATWAAGLLWNKYVVKVTEGKEDTDPMTYGDKKISEAKALLNSVNTDTSDDDSAGVQIGVFSINGST